MFMLAIMMLQAATPLADTPASTAANQDVLVSAESLANTRSALDRCLAERCAPDRDIRSSLHYANQQFLAGDYRAARVTIAESRSRNDRFAKTFPEPVSDLARASARLAGIDGRQDLALSASLDALDALKTGLPSDDPIILMQRLEYGDQLARQGRIYAAAAVYDKVAAQARHLGNIAAEGHALFRNVLLYSALASVDPVFRSSARGAIAKIERRSEPQMAAFREGIALVAAQLKVLEAKPEQREAVLASAPKTGLFEPAILYEPFIDLTRAGLTGTESASLHSEWADVGFWVKPDGSVEDVEVRAQSEYKPGPWLAIKLKSVAGRRYASFTMAADGPGMYRVERYSMVYDMVRPSASRVAVRADVGRIDTAYLSSTYKDRTVPVN